MMHGNSNIKFCEEFSDGNLTALTKTIYITKQGYGYVNAMGIRGWRKLCKERAEWKKVTEKAKPHSGL
jgi:hypothetical protein